MLCGVFMEKLFYTDSHMRHFDARVTSCRQEGDRFAVMLDRTAFYPEGGGQPADTGTLGGSPVLDVREREGEIMHFMETPIPPNTPVAGEINWERRFSLMQQHSGEHMVSGIIRRLHGLDNVGFHLGTDTVTVDFNGALSEADLVHVERLANEAVYANLVIGATRPEPDKLAGMMFRSKIALDSDVRIVSIPGVDDCACCGVHVAQTGEIGIVKLLSARRHKGGTRLEMVCGRRALQDYAAKHISVTDISNSLSSKPAEVSDAVRRLMEDCDVLKREIASMRETRLVERAEAVIRTLSIPHAGTENQTGMIWFEPNLSPEFLRRFFLLLVGRLRTCSPLTGTCPEWMAVFSGAGDSVYFYVAGSVLRGETGEGKPTPAWDARTLAKRLNLACNGRGGGSAELVQGSVQAARPDIEAALASFDES